MAGHGSACSSSLQGYPVENEELHYLSFLSYGKPQLYGRALKSVQAAGSSCPQECGLCELLLRQDGFRTVRVASPGIFLHLIRSSSENRGFHFYQSGIESSG